MRTETWVVRTMPDGGVQAETTKQIIIISPNGKIQFFEKNLDKTTGKLIFEKAGVGK